MVIGVPREIKTQEYRVGITPSGVEELKGDGHTLLVETGAGEGSGFPDKQYTESGADIVDRKTLFVKADLVVKVKEPLSSEYELLKEDSALFTYLHLAPNRSLTELLLLKKITSLAYETLTKDGTLPLLQPMSEIAGRMAPLVGAYYLQKPHGGTGLLPMGVAGVKPAKAVILGAGTVGFNAARVCSGLEMETVVLNKGIARLERLNDYFSGKVKTVSLSASNIRDEIKDADIVIGAILVPGGKTPVMITQDMLQTMKKGAVIVDVSIDQGGCVETSRPTTHDNPVYEVEGIIHYMVANMPGAYPRTSTLALTNATLPYIRTLASLGIEKAIEKVSSLKSALNTHEGKIVHEELAKVFAG
ncbi:MAG TPA: alanine dehydrogenase [Dissulfurispiraceae bacterium]|nr:alanine dehydrogenase [Dissulfurispiraceae bacterium]